MRAPRLSRDTGAMLAIALAVIVAHAPFLLGLTVADPLGPRTQLTSAPTSGLIAGTPVLDGNDGVISQALGHRAALDLIHLQLPWWNPDAGAGTPLAGEMQSAALFAPTLLTLMANGQLWEHMLLELIAAIATFWLARSLGLGRIAGTVGAIAFGLNGTFAWFGHATVNPVCFLPLTLLGIERAAAAARAQARGGWGLIALSGALAVYAGFPEVVYIDSLLAVVWWVWRLAGLPAAQRAAMTRKVLTGALVGGLLCAPLLVSVFDFLPRAVIPQHTSGYFGSVHVPSASLPQLVLPYVYGPLFAFASSGWATVGGYISSSLLVLAVIGVASPRQRGLRLALLGWLILALARIYDQPPLLGHVLGLLPGMGQIDFARYAFAAMELPVVVLAALGLDDLIRGGVARRRLVASLGLALALVAVAALGAHPLSGRLGSVYARDHYYAGAIAWGVVGVLGVGLAGLIGAARVRVGSVVALVLVDVIVLFALPELSAPRRVRVDLTPVAYLGRHLGQARFATFGPLGPNYGAYFGLASVNLSDGAIATDFAHYVETRLDLTLVPPLLLDLRGPGAVLLTATSNAELVSHLAGYRAAAVRYVVVAPVRPLPAGPFRLVQRTPTALIYQLADSAAYFTATRCRVAPQGASAVTLDCPGPSTLIRRETYLPGWSAQAGARALTVTADGPFQQVSVPAGRSHIAFSFTPPHMLIGWLGFGAGCLWLLVARLPRRRSAAG